jgi:hypothetical protein
VSDNSLAELNLSTRRVSLIMRALGSVGTTYRLSTHTEPIIPEVNPWRECRRASARTRLTAPCALLLNGRQAPAWRRLRTAVSVLGCSHTASRRVSTIANEDRRGAGWSRVGLMDR